MEDRRVAGNSRQSVRQRYRLVLADDHQDILDEVRSLLSANFDVLSAVKDGHALLESAAELRPDAVICDIAMPGVNGIESSAQILRQGHCSAAIVLTMCNESPVVDQALQEGIRGYVLKEDAGEELIPAVYAVMAGDRYLSQGVADQQSHRSMPLDGQSQS